MTNALSILTVAKIIEEQSGVKQTISIEEVCGSFPKRKAIYIHDIGSQHSFMSVTMDNDYIYVTRRAPNDRTRCILLDTEIRCNGGDLNDISRIYIPLDEYSNNDGVIQIDNNIVTRIDIENSIVKLFKDKMITENIKN